MSVKRFIGLSLLFLLSSSAASSQEISEEDQIGAKTDLYGFIRGGFYYGLMNGEGKDYFSSGYSDLALKINCQDQSTFRAFADIRMRYGLEFGESINYARIREAYVKTYLKNLDLSIGQQIIKWGKTDFVNPLSRLSPSDFMVRSPERDDMDLGNLIADIKLRINDFIGLETALVPFHRSSVLLTDVVPLPDYVTLNNSRDLITDLDYLSFGLKADLHVRGLDAEVIWFEGYDPVPGIELTDFSIDMSGSVPLPSASLYLSPYKTRVAGLSLESFAGNLTFRAGAARTFPFESHWDQEYVPLPEAIWVGGIDYVRNDLRVILEYSGKYICDFREPLVDPIAGDNISFPISSSLFSDPLFDPGEFVRQQISSFNRLYNYQLDKIYNSIGLRIENSFAYGKINASIQSLFNFNSHDLLLIPEVRLKRSDRLSLIAGFEYYSGRDDSLYDLIDNFMNSIYASIRIDF